MDASAIGRTQGKESHRVDSGEGPTQKGHMERTNMGGTQGEDKYVRDIIGEGKP